MANPLPPANIVTPYLRHTLKPTTHTRFILLDHPLQLSLLPPGLGCIQVLGKVRACTRIKPISLRLQLLVRLQ